jgi:hypothetical protein
VGKVASVTEVVSVKLNETISNIHVAGCFNMDNKRWLAFGHATLSGLE